MSSSSILTVNMWDGVNLPPSLQGATAHVDIRLENFTDEELEAAATLARSLESLEARTPELPATAEPGVHRLLPLAGMEWGAVRGLRERPLRDSGDCHSGACGNLPRAEKGGAGGENDQPAEPTQVGQCTLIFVGS